LGSRQVSQFLCLFSLKLSLGACLVSQLSRSFPSHLAQLSSTVPEVLCVERGPRYIWRISAHLLVAPSS
jgi:hypothetical protein